MEGKGKSFIKGGCGCLAAFALLALGAIAVGGQVHIDFGGALCLFVSGGLLGLLVLWIYNKGRRDARSNLYDHGEVSRASTQGKPSSLRDCPNCHRLVDESTLDGECPHCGTSLAST